MKHDFLRKSMEQRIENKIIENNNRRELTIAQQNRHRVMNKAATLRSQSVLASVKAQGDRYGSPMSRGSFDHKSLNNSMAASGRS